MATETTQLIPPGTVERRCRQQYLEEKHKRLQYRRGLGLTALSALAFAAMALLVRILQDSGYTPTQIMLWRSITQSISAGVLSMAIGVHPLRIGGGWRMIRWVVSRSVFGGLGHLLYYIALGKMPMGVATVLFFTNPMFTAVFAFWALREPFSRRHRILTAMCLAGIVMIVKPSASGVSPWALVVLLGAASNAVAYISVRVAGSGVHAIVYVVYFGVICAVGSLGGVVVQGGVASVVPESAGEGLVLVLVGVSALMAQFLMNRGLQLASAGPVSMMRNVDVVFGFVFDVAIYSALPDAWSIVGAAVITLALVLMSIY